MPNTSKLHAHEEQAQVTTGFFVHLAA